MPQFKDTWGGQLGMAVAQNAGTGFLGGLIGQVFAKSNDRRQIRQQQKLQDMQIAGTKQLTDYNYQKELDMWKATSYPGQIEMMKQAGLNPALLYGKGGGGGTTIGTPAGAIGMATAQQNPGEATAGMGMMMQNQNIAAQTELIKAQTEKTKAETAKTSGVDTENIKADTANKILNSVLLEYTGKEAKDTYEKVNVPNRGVQQQAEQFEYEARQGIANTLYQLWNEGKLKEKSLAEIESILLANSKSREETKQISKSIDLIEENIKGVKLDNIIKELETKLQNETGIDRNSPWYIKMLGRLFVNLMR